MRILTINTNPVGPDGITNVILNLIESMDMCDMTIDFMAINEPKEKYSNAFTQAGGTVHVIPRNVSHPICYLRKLVRLLKKESYDVVHAHGSSATLALEMLAAWLAGCKVRIAHSHNTTCKHMTLHKLLFPLFHLLCTHRLACGIEAGKWLHGNSNFVVVNNGVKTGRFAFSDRIRKEKRKALGIGDTTKLIGHVGIFNEAKNQNFLVEILDKLNDEYKLLLLGHGSMRESVAQKVSDLGLSDRVIFGGVTDRVEDYLCAFDLLVMPSLYEGLPLSLIEAQASGLMCLVSENITHEVDKTGNLTFLSLEAGAEKWAQAVQEMKLPEDRNEASKVAIERIIKHGYDIQTEAEKLRCYYINAVEAVK